MKKTNFSTLAMVICILLLASCSKDDQTVIPEPSQPVFTITFMNDYVSPQLPVVLFLSYPDGTNYTDTTCSVNGTYKIYAPAGKPIPPTFMVTLVNTEPYWHSFNVRISTFAAIPMGSAWAVSGFRADTTGTCKVSLENMPVSTSVILYSCAGYYDLTLHSSGRTLYLYQQPDDLYVKIQTPKGEVYKYMQGLLSNGGNYTVDMSDTQPASEKTVFLPFEVQNYSAILYGYKDDNYDSPLSCVSDYVLATGMPVTQINLHYPPSRFSGFHTQMLIEKFFDSDESYLYNTEGEIPSGFRKIDASISALQPGTANVTFTATGTFDMTSAMWEYIDPSNIIFGWKFWAPDTTRTIQLPDIPPAFSSLFPSISHDKLIFQFTELSDLLTVASYAELTEKLFDPSHPSRMERYDASVIRKRFVPFTQPLLPQN